MKDPDKKHSIYVSICEIIGMIFFALPILGLILGANTEQFIVALGASLVVGTTWFLAAHVLKLLETIAGYERSSSAWFRAKESETRSATLPRDDKEWAKKRSGKL